MRAWLRAVLSGRPAWMNALLLFCVYMAVIYVPWDLFAKPVAQDEEVWFGILFHGAAAKVLALPHWFVYAAGAWGFLRMRPFMWPWAPLYVLQIAVGMLVWAWLYTEGAGPRLGGAVAALAFGGLALALHRGRPLFRGGPPNLRERYGRFALVTGASSGIGAAFARAFAGHGMDLVLTGRRAEALEGVAEEIRRDFGVEVRTLCRDLAEPGAAEAVAEAVRDLDVGVVVQNAGTGDAGAFATREPARIFELTLVHAATPAVLTRLLLPAMLARGRGAVIFTGSLAGAQPLPWHAVYSAAKGFQRLLGEALFVELRGTGVDALVVEPGTTRTAFQERAGEVPHGGDPPEEVVRTALEALGRQPSVIPGWLRWLRTQVVVRLLPRSLAAFLAGERMRRLVPPERLAPGPSGGEGAPGARAGAPPGEP